MSEQKQAGVVELVDAGVPADQGLSSLGLLMQLAGNLFAAGAGLMAFMMLFAMRSSDKMLWVLVLLGVSVARSIYHRNAGAQLIYGAPSPVAEGSNQRTAGIKRYVIVALIQTLIVGALFAGKFHVPGKLAVAIMLGLAVWPATLAVLFSLPRFQRFRNDLPLPEDKGFEGAAILMTVLGLCGALFTGTLLLLLLDLPSRVLTKGPGVLIVLAVAILVFRSLLHVQAGVSGLRETSVDRSVELANRYANFGVISSFCGAGAMLFIVMQLPMGAVGLAIVCGLCWMLMAWPLVIRRFFGDRQFADLLAGEGAPLHRRAPDAGLTSLGWLLLAHAAMSASALIPDIVLGTSDDIGKMQELLAGFGGGSLERSMWFAVGLVLLQGWAGFELIRMSPQSRAVATIFGVAGALITIYVNWPMLHGLDHMRGFDLSEALEYGSVAVALVLPAATLVLVNRKIAPTAKARIRQKPAAKQPSTPA